MKRKKNKFAGKKTPPWKQRNPLKENLAMTKLVLYRGLTQLEETSSVISRKLTRRPASNEIKRNFSNKL